MKYNIEVINEHISHSLGHAGVNIGFKITTSEDGQETLEQCYKPYLPGTSDVAFTSWLWPSREAFWALCGALPQDERQNAVGWLEGNYLVASSK